MRRIGKITCGIVLCLFVLIGTAGAVAPESARAADVTVSAVVRHIPDSETTTTIDKGNPVKTGDDRAQTAMYCAAVAIIAAAMAIILAATERKSEDDQ